MNEFLGQFLLESRELVSQATEGLLILERSPADPERIDAVFRAFHTLKGGAGIVDFTAMERAVHAAEEVLTAVRAANSVLTAALVGDCLHCLDQIVQWLDALEASGELPADSEREADRIVERFRVADAVTATTEWIDEALERNTSAAHGARVAIRFTPDADCFFQGEDPLARMVSLPQLLALTVEPLSAWGELGELDIYRCNLVFIALGGCTVEAASAHLREHSGSCEIRPIAAQTPADDPNSTLPPRPRDVLRAQLALIGDIEPAAFAGTIGAAGLVAGNVLRYCGRIGHAELLALATDASLAERSPDPLRTALEEALTSQQAIDVQADAAPQLATAAIRTVRVDAERIDALVRLTGELTVAKNAIGHVLKLAQAEGQSLAALLKERHSVLEHLVGELQRSVLGIRVLPLRTVLQRFPRVLRDVAASLGKQVALQIEGDDTEADKAIVEMLFEPLLHVLRNALDHGIESPQLRLARNKPAVARIVVRASHEADQVVIQVSDDGGGVDVARVRDVAAQRGVLDTATLRDMSDAEVVDLIFVAGFSTAARVTELSGRGVGMDAVRSAVEKVGGRVSIESRPDIGTTVRFALPFSVMMSQVMTVEAGGQLFGVPLDAVVETVRVARESIVRIGAADAIVLRERTLPVVDLAGLLGADDDMHGAPEVTLVIVACAGQRSAIRVDRIGERLEVMLKPLEGLLSGTPGISGTTLLGDGRVLLVLDIGELLL